MTTPALTPDVFMAQQKAPASSALTPDSFMAQQNSHWYTGTPLEGVGDTLGREVSSLGKSVVGIPGAIYHAAADPETPEESQRFGEGFEKKIGPTGRIIDRMGVQPVLNAVDWYTKAAQGKIPDPVGQALSVAPEAMGVGASAPLTSKLVQSVPNAARRVVGATPSVASAPIRLAARSAEAAVNSKLKPTLKLFTPADEALDSTIKIPGRDLGLKQPTYPGAPLPAATPDMQSDAAAKALPAAFQPLPPKAPPVPGTADMPFRSDEIGQRFSQASQPQTPPQQVPAVAKGLQNVLNDSLGVKPLQPNVPLKSQLPAHGEYLQRMKSQGAQQQVPQSSAASPAEPEHMGQFARANGLELHQSIPETVAGDVLRAKIHNLTNVQVRQLAINAGEDMGQQSVTNAKNAGGVTRQEVLSRILAKHTPEEIGQMIDQGQHLPSTAGNLVLSADAPLFNPQANEVQRGSISASLARRNGR